jgi:hypothetical protein
MFIFYENKKSQVGTKLAKIFKIENIKRSKTT